MNALALLLALGAGAAAQGTTPPVVLCTTEFPPYVSTELPDGGRITALARRAFAEGGLTVETQQLPWVRAFALAKGSGCLLLTLWRNDERDALFRYSLPVARMELGLFVRGDRKEPLPPDATVAYQRGSYLPPALAAGRYKLHEVLDPRVGVEMLKRGRVDAVFSERETLDHLLLRQPALAQGIRWHAPALEVKTTHMAISKQHPQAEAWLELLDREIRRSVRN
ncbi:transporter substrate-binding domain-containing protein [Roseateles asaccharophilus]|uniref:Polar amino acid transport system substrate-binding protein n=1 Tax=Roseateles asaccharophilus TaxID=582607 RepID=A0ABU2AD21_9BURK|nr:transporter substrate-binding domain-containing protein [Roseateles asaccharophilus]MDR7335005.1 polar amino acid transport system substrate-binding protein [Roseateles asaccharophilus]